MREWEGREVLHRVRSEVLALLVPPLCAACRVPLERPDRLVCVACLGALPWLRGKRCARCGLAAHASPWACPARAAAFDAAWAPWAYAGPAQRLVGALKFRGALPVADLMAAQIVASAPRGWLAPPGVLVAVPTHASRRRRRGFDQAERLADAVARRAGLGVAPCLRRTGPATRQVGATRAGRRDPSRLRLRATGPVPERAILVDDVHTTGATLDRAATALRAAGAREVLAITYARTP